MYSTRILEYCISFLEKDQPVNNDKKSFLNGDVCGQVAYTAGGVGGRVEYRPPFALMAVNTRSLAIWNMETR